MVELAQCVKRVIYKSEISKVCRNDNNFLDILMFLNTVFMFQQILTQWNFTTDGNNSYRKISYSVKV